MRGPKLERCSNFVLHTDPGFIYLYALFIEGICFSDIALLSKQLSPHSEYIYVHFTMYAISCNNNNNIHDSSITNYTQFDPRTFCMPSEAHHRHATTLLHAVYCAQYNVCIWLMITMYIHVIKNWMSMHKLTVRLAWIVLDLVVMGWEFHSWINHKIGDCSTI